MRKRQFAIVLLAVLVVLASSAFAKPEGRKVDNPAIETALETETNKLLVTIKGLSDPQLQTKLSSFIDSISKVKSTNSISLNDRYRVNLLQSFSEELLVQIRNVKECTKIKLEMHKQFNRDDLNEADYHPSYTKSLRILKAVCP